MLAYVKGLAKGVKTASEAFRIAEIPYLWLGAVREALEGGSYNLKRVKGHRHSRDIFLQRRKVGSVSFNGGPSFSASTTTLRSLLRFAASEISESSFYRGSPASWFVVAENVLSANGYRLQGQAEGAVGIIGRSGDYFGSLWWEEGPKYGPNFSLQFETIRPLLEATETEWSKNIR